MADPMRKEVSWVRKKIDSVNKELKPLGATVQKKVKNTFQDHLLHPITSCYKKLVFTKPKLKTPKSQLNRFLGSDKRFDIARFGFTKSQNLKTHVFVCICVCNDLKQEREYKEALDTFNEKNREKVQLITKLMEVSFEFSVLISLNQENQTEYTLTVLVCFHFFLISPWGDGTVGWRKREAEVEEAGRAKQEHRHRVKMVLSRKTRPINQELIWV